VSYRRLDPIQAARSWREFSLVNLPLFRTSGLPTALTEHAAFEHFLVNGSVAVADGTTFTVARLDESGRRVVGRLVAKYVDRFGDPGLADDIRALVAHE
jgi:hypothetical protein